MLLALLVNSTTTGQPMRFSVIALLNDYDLSTWVPTKLDDRELSYAPSTGISLSTSWDPIRGFIAVWWWDGGPISFATAQNSTSTFAIRKDPFPIPQTLTRVTQMASAQGRWFLLGTTGTEWNQTVLITSDPLNSFDAPVFQTASLTWPIIGNNSVSASVILHVSESGRAYLILNCYLISLDVCTTTRLREDRIYFWFMVPPSNNLIGPLLVNNSFVSLSCIGTAVGGQGKIGGFIRSPLYATGAILMQILQNPTTNLPIDTFYSFWDGSVMGPTFQLPPWDGTYFSLLTGWVAAHDRNLVKFGKMATTAPGEYEYQSVLPVGAQKKATPVVCMRSENQYGFLYVGPRYWLGLVGNTSLGYVFGVGTTPSSSLT